MNNKLLNILLIPLSLIIIIAILTWSPVCSNLVEMANGNMTFMKCHYTANVAILISILLFVVSLESLIKKDSRPLSIIAIGIILILITLDSTGIGVCMNSEMSCNKTKLWIQIPAAIIIFIGLYLGYNNKKSIS